MSRERAQTDERRCLTHQQDRFVAEYVVDLNATRAAIRAGYSPKTARSQGHRLLTNVDIAAAVSKRTQQHLEQVELTAAGVLEAIRRQVCGDIRALFTSDGTLKPISELSAEEADLIASFETIVKNAKAGNGHLETVFRIKFKDKIRYLEMAAKHFGLLKQEQPPRAKVEKLHVLIERKPTS